MVYNVLVVDDSLFMRKVIIKALRECGLEVNNVYEASNGAEGLEAFEKKEINLALVDINMPVMSGEEMVEKLKQNPKHQDLPILFVSSEDISNRIEILLKQKVGFVHKPFEANILKDSILATIKEISEKKS